MLLLAQNAEEEIVRSWPQPVDYFLSKRSPHSAHMRRAASCYDAVPCRNHMNMTFLPTHSSPSPLRRPARPEPFLRNARAAVFALNTSRLLILSPTPTVKRSNGSSISSTTRFQPTVC